MLEYFTQEKEDKKAIDVILKLVEKQQKEIEERNIRLQEEINENCKLKTELYGNSISKDKIKEIIYPSPDNYIPVEVQMSEMYRRLKNLLEE